VDFSNFGNINLASCWDRRPQHSCKFHGSPLVRSLGQADTLWHAGRHCQRQFQRYPFAQDSASLQPDLTLQDGRVYTSTVTLATQGGGRPDGFHAHDFRSGTFNSSFVSRPSLR